MGNMEVVSFFQCVDAIFEYRSLLLCRSQGEVTLLKHLRLGFYLFEVSYGSTSFRLSWVVSK